MNYRTLNVTADSRGVLTIRLNRPEVRNAINEEVIHELTEVFEKETVNKDLRAIVLRGNGPNFCAGGDLNWMKKSVEYTYEENLKDTKRLSSLFAKMNECSKPLIALVHGAAIGGGVGLVSVCDMVIASANTQFSLSEVRLGIVPACIGPFVIAKIGASHARRYFMTAERFQASVAKEIGLIHQIVETENELEPTLENLLNQILQCSPNALRIAKQMILDLSWPERRAEKSNYLDYVSETLADVRISSEGQEGVRAFLEKRKPNWLLEKTK